MNEEDIDLIIFKVANWIRNSNKFVVQEDKVLSNDLRHLSIFWKKESEKNFLFNKFKVIDHYLVLKLFLLCGEEWMLTAFTKSTKWDFNKLINDLEIAFNVKITIISTVSHCYAYDKNFIQSRTINNNELD